MIKGIVLKDEKLRIITGLVYMTPAFVHFLVGWRLACVA